MSKSKCSTCNSDRSDVKFPIGSRGKKVHCRIYSDESSGSKQSKRRKGQNQISETDLMVILSSDEDSLKNKCQFNFSVNENCLNN